MKLRFRSINLVAISFSLCFPAIVDSDADTDAKTANNKPLDKTPHVYKTVEILKVEANVSRPVA